MSKTNIEKHCLFLQDIYHLRNSADNTHHIVDVPTWYQSSDDSEAAADESEEQASQ